MEKDESTVKKILNGLGIDDYMQPINTFSGGWRMKISLARALYLKPTLLILDEPTNHLDLNAVIWLTHYLAHEWKNTLIVVSHHTDFLNNVCSDIIHLSDQQLTYYKGNYDDFVKGHQLYLQKREKDWKKIQNQLKELRRKSTPKQVVDDFILKHQSKKPSKPYQVSIYHPSVNLIKSSIIELSNVSFSYDKPVLNNINLNINIDTRLTIVGKNGSGKSTLLKLMMGQLKADQGTIEKNEISRISYYTQYSSDSLPLDKTAIEYIHGINPQLNLETIRKYLGSIGIPGKQHTKPIAILSGGQKARLVFVSICVTNPHLILMDEPTNHMDIETIDALIKAINEYEGGIVMITHHIDLIRKTTSRLLELHDGCLEYTTLDAYEDKIINSLSD